MPQSLPGRNTFDTVSQNDMLECIYQTSVTEVAGLKPQDRKHYLNFADDDLIRRAPWPDDWLLWRVKCKVSRLPPLI